jgi:hypothetical protein
MEARRLARRRDERRKKKGLLHLVGLPPLTASQAGRLRHRKDGKWAPTPEPEPVGPSDYELDKRAAEWLAVQG